MIVVDGTSDRRPRSLDGEHSLLSVAFDERSGRRVEENGFDTEEGKGSCSRLGLRRSGKRTAAQAKSASAERRSERN